MSDREYCVRLQMAFEMAYPDVPQTDAQREREVTACVARVAPQRANGELAHAIQCMDRHIHGKGYATKEYLAFMQCQAARSVAAGAGP